MDIEQLLRKRGLKLQDLEPEEQETLNTWLVALNNNQITVASIREYIAKMRSVVVQALADLDETPNDWLSVLGLFIPLIGIIRKWYLDQKKNNMIARLRNYVLLEAFLLSPEQAKKAIERAVANISSGKSR